MILILIDLGKTGMPSIGFSLGCPSRENPSTNNSWCCHFTLFYSWIKLKNRLSIMKSDSLEFSQWNWHIPEFDRLMSNLTRTVWIASTTFNIYTVFTLHSLSSTPFFNLHSFRSTKSSYFQSTTYTVFTLHNLPSTLVLNLQLWF